METTLTAVVTFAFGLAALGWTLLKARERIELSRAKHRSAAGHVRLARRIAALLPFYEFDATSFFQSDGAPDTVAQQRRDGFRALSDIYGERFKETRRATTDVATSLSDVQFTGRYRVPFQYSRMVREHLSAGAFVKETKGVTVTDLDDNRFYDLTGSYGVNLFGHEFYKTCIAQGEATGRALGPVLGVYHPFVGDNVKRLREVSGLDEVSFHMSGTEAVMQAVRLAQYHTGRSRLVRFSGAYHGWWGDVQPGIGNPVTARDTLTLAEMSERTLTVLRRRRDIACVLVNPLQALHPNMAASADSALLDSSRRAGADRAAYTSWLKDLRAVCAEREIVLIFDEVFVGFRLAPGGAQEYFGVQADLVTYGKTVGGGLPVGVLCGQARLMRRYKDERPGDICFARGTFNAHPYVMGAMASFFKGLDTPAIQACYDDLDGRWNTRAKQLNDRLAGEGLPVRVANLSSIFTILYTRPSRYNWMLQYYLRAEGLALSWVGTGRLIFSLDYGGTDFDAVVERFVAAARAMERDGWWYPAIASNKDIRRRVVRELVAAKWKTTFTRRATKLDESVLARAALD